MTRAFTSPPCPSLTIRIDLPAGGGETIDLSSIPAGPGVFLIQDEIGRTLALGTSANLRRALKEKLRPPDDRAGPSRRMDLASQARSIGALPVGSSFEADWAWLQLARSAAGELASTYRAAVDHWRGWFVHVDENARFPRLVKTSSLDSTPDVAGSPGFTYLGPMPDKHAAQRYIELLQSVFDLCRYHHILVEAPHAIACAYKEMGRCPAPCDGTVSMDHYHGQIRAAIEFAQSPYESWRVEMQQKISTATGADAARLQRMLDDASGAARPAFAHVDRLDRFQFLAVAPSERRGWSRLVWIDGGWIEPWADVSLDASKDALAGLVDEIESRRPRTPRPLTRTGPHPRPRSRNQSTGHFDVSPAQIENIGLVSHHLFIPPAKSRTSFLKLTEPVTTARLRTALKRTARESAAALEVADQSIDLTNPVEEE